MKYFGVSLFYPGMYQYNDFAILQANTTNERFSISKWTKHINQWYLCSSSRQEFQIILLELARFIGMPELGTSFWARIPAILALTTLAIWGLREASHHGAGNGDNT